MSTHPGYVPVMDPVRTPSSARPRGLTAPVSYVEQVADVVPGTSPETAMADGLFLCQQILAGERGADSVVELVRAHFADRVELDHDQVVAILQAVLTDAAPGETRRARPTWRRPRWRQPVAAWRGA